MESAARAAQPRRACSRAVLAGRDERIPRFSVRTGRGDSKKPSLKGIVFSFCRSFLWCCRAAALWGRPRACPLLWAFRGGFRPRTRRAAPPAQNDFG